MKNILLPALAIVVAACANTDPAMERTGTMYGEGVTLAEATPIADILERPAEHVGRTVLVEGTVDDVCEKKGCWLDIVADGVEIQVKVTDDVIVFPVSTRGKTALVEGVVQERQLTPEQAFAAAAHRAEEQGLPFDSTTTYPATTVYRIMGTGALIRG